MGLEDEKQHKDYTTENPTGWYDVLTPGYYLCKACLPHTSLKKPETHEVTILVKPGRDWSLDQVFRWVSENYGLGLDFEEPVKKIEAQDIGDEKVIVLGEK